METLGAPAAPAPALDDLLLLRLAVATPPDAGVTRSRVAADLAPLLGAVDGGGASGASWRERFAAAADRRVAAGEVSRPGRGRLALTAAGRAAAGAKFGETAAAPLGGGFSWVQVRDGLLVARALGQAGAADDLAALRGADALRAAILLREHAPDAADAGPARPKTLREVANLLAARAVRARRGTPAELRAALLRGWLATSPAPAEPGVEVPAPITGTASLADFAAAVRAAAQSCPETLRLGEMVFIADVWDAFRDRVPRPFPGLEPGADLAAFKQRLGEANAAGLLRLSRADLAGLRSPEVLAASEVRWMGATFHLLRLA